MAAARGILSAGGGERMTSAKLPASASIRRVHLRVADIERSRAFYADTLGLNATMRGDDSVALGARGPGGDFLAISALPKTRPRPTSTFGLYHFAILYPDRTSLALALRRLAAARWPFTGFADHGVSEAAYLDDPDGNGIELYFDRPRPDWPYRDGRIALVTLPLDVEGLLRHAADHDDNEVFDAVPRIGHIHLHVRDLARSTAFFHALGMDSMATLPGAGFLSAGGYHHHVGINTWARREPSPDVAGLLDWTLEIGDEAARGEALDRLAAAGVNADEYEDGHRVEDPDGNVLLLPRTKTTAT
jgi:catechol 2,3-dioxygenase